MAMLRFHESRVQRLLREIGQMSIDQIVQAEGVFIQLSHSGSPVKQVFLAITRNELVVINQEVPDKNTYDGIQLSINRILPLCMLRFFITDEHERRFIVCTNYGHVLQFEMCRLPASASDRWPMWRDFLNTARQEDKKATMKENNNMMIPRVSGFVRRFSHAFANKEVRSIGIQTSDEITFMTDVDTKETFECNDSDSSSDSQDYEIDPFGDTRLGYRPGDRLSILAAYCAPVCLSNKAYTARMSQSMSDCTDHRFQFSFQKELEQMKQPSNERLKFRNGIKYRESFDVAERIKIILNYQRISHFVQSPTTCKASLILYNPRRRVKSVCCLFYFSKISPFDSESSSDSEEDLDDVFKSAGKEMLNTAGKPRAARELWTLVKKRLLKSGQQTRAIVFKKVVQEGCFITSSQKEEGLPSTIIELDPLDVSMQLAYLSRKLLLAVSVEDLRAYAASNGAKVTKPLRTLLEFSADVRKMVITEIIKNAGYGYCVAWKFFIQIAMNLLFRHHDFQSLIAVLRGLSSLELYRLKNCWATLFVQEPFAFCHYLTLIQLLHPDKSHKALANRTKICISQTIPFIPSFEHLLEHCLVKRQIQPETNKNHKTFANNSDTAKLTAFFSKGDLKGKTEVKLSAKCATATNITPTKETNSQPEHRKESKVSQPREKLTIEGNADKKTTPQNQRSDIKFCDTLKSILSKKKPSNTGPSIKLSPRRNKPWVRFDVSESESEEDEESNEEMKHHGMATFVKHPDDLEEESDDEMNEEMQEVVQSETHVDNSQMTYRNTDANNTILVRTPVIDYYCLTKSREIVNSTMLQIASMIKSGKFNNISEDDIEDKSVDDSDSDSSVSEADEQPNVTEAVEARDITIDDILPSMSPMSSEMSLNRDINTIFENCKTDDRDDLIDSKARNSSKALEQMDSGGDKRAEKYTKDKKSKKGEKKRMKLFRSWKLKKKGGTKAAIKHVNEVQLISDFKTFDDDDEKETTKWKNDGSTLNTPTQQLRIQKPQRGQLKSGVDENDVVENNARRASYVPDLVTRGRRKSMFQEAAENKVSDKDESKMFEDLKIKKLNQSKRKGSLALALLYPEEEETDKNKMKKISEKNPSKTGFVASVVDTFNNLFQNEKYNNQTNNSLPKPNKLGKDNKISEINNKRFENEKDDFEHGENIVYRSRSSSLLLFGSRKQVNVDKCSLCDGERCLYGMEIGELFETIQTRALHMITKSRHRVKNCMKSIMTVNKHINDIDMLQLSLYLE